MMFYKEYNVDEGRQFDIRKLAAPRMPTETYAQAHSGIVIACHDIIIKHTLGSKTGALLVVRDNVPFRGELWVLGGRIERGLPLEESLRKKVKEECNLELDKISLVGLARLYGSTDPFGHGLGTDTFAAMFFGTGRGELKLDSLHKQPTIVTAEEFRRNKAHFHPYVRDFMELLIEQGLL